MTYKYTVDTEMYRIFKYMEDDELCDSSQMCFEDFKDAKRCLLEALDKKVQWALQINSRNYCK